MNTVRRIIGIVVVSACFAGAGLVGWIIATAPSTAIPAPSSTTAPTSTTVATPAVTTPSSNVSGKNPFTQIVVVPPTTTSTTAPAK